MGVFVDWNGPYDDGWTNAELDELGILAYAHVDGVEIDEVGAGDPLPVHGVNEPGDQG